MRSSALYVKQCLGLFDQQESPDTAGRAPSTLWPYIDGYAIPSPSAVSDGVSWAEMQPTSTAITGITNTVGATVTATAHGLSANQQVAIAEVLGATGANGCWTVQSVTTNTFTINNTVAPGAYTSGGYCAGLALNNAVDQAITAVRASNTANPTNGGGNGWKLVFRVLMGTWAPTWAKSLDGSPLTNIAGNSTFSIAQAGGLSGVIASAGAVSNLWLYHPPAISPGNWVAGFDISGRGVAFQVGGIQIATLTAAWSSGNNPTLTVAPLSQALNNGDSIALITGSTLQVVTVNQVGGVAQGGTSVPVTGTYSTTFPIGSTVSATVPSSTGYQEVTAVGTDTYSWANSPTPLSANNDTTSAHAISKAPVTYGSGPNPSSTITLGRTWTANYLTAVENFYTMIANAYDNVPELVLVFESGSQISPFSESTTKGNWQDSTSARQLINAGAQVATLSSASGTGANPTLSVSALSEAIPSGALVSLVSTDGVTFQQFTVASPGAAQSATSLPVSGTPVLNFPIGTTVTYGGWTIAAEMANQEAMYDFMPTVFKRTPTTKDLNPYYGLSATAVLNTTVIPQNTLGLTTTVPPTWETDQAGGQGLLYYVTVTTPANNPDVCPGQHVFSNNSIYATTINRSDTITFTNLSASFTDTSLTSADVGTQLGTTSAPIPVSGGVAYIGTVVGSTGTMVDVNGNPVTATSSIIGTYTVVSRTAYPAGSTVAHWPGETAYPQWPVFSTVGYVNSSDVVTTYQAARGSNYTSMFQMFAVHGRGNARRMLPLQPNAASRFSSWPIHLIPSTASKMGGLANLPQVIAECIWLGAASMELVNSYWTVLTPAQTAYYRNAILANAT